MSNAKNVLSEFYKTYNGEKCMVNYDKKFNITHDESFYITNEKNILKASFKLFNNENESANSYKYALKYKQKYLQKYLQLKNQ